MNMPNLVRHGLYRSFESGYNSDAINMLYTNTKKSPEEISEMIRETWSYIKTNEVNISNHVLSHFFYLLGCEVDRVWVEDISLEIVKYGLNHNDVEVIDNAIGLIESWNDKDILDLLFNTKIKLEWLGEYKMKVLEHFGYSI